MDSSPLSPNTMGSIMRAARSFWRRRSLPSLLCEWLGEWFRGVRAARMGYSTWLYVQCSGGCMIPMDMLDWDTDWID